MKRITKIEDNKLFDIKNKLRVAAYCRVSSSSDEQLVSLEAQKQHYEAYIKSNSDWVYAGLYYDEGITGTKKDKRAGLMSMISDCEHHKIDFIITKSISRFARNTMDCLELVRKLLELGVNIYFEKENLNTGDMEGELMLSILSSLAESESVSISENNKWSIKKRFQNGTYISFPPYGYKNVNGEMVIDEEQAKIIRFIFSEILSGKGIANVAKELNEMNVPTKKNGRWSSSTIRAILENEKYIGDALFQKTYTDNHFDRHKNNGELDQYLVENHHAAIISRHDYEKAKLLVEQHAKEKGITKGEDKYNNTYPFTKKIRCGECGTNFKRRVHSSGRRYIAWCCSMHLSDKEKCSMQFIRDEEVKMAFINMINKLIFGRKQILKPLLESLKKQSQSDILRRVQELEEHLEKNLERRQIIKEIMAKGYLEPALFNKENNELIQESEELKMQKEQLLYETKDELRKKDEVVRLLKFTEKAEMISEFDEDIFNEYVDMIEIVSRKEFVFKLKCGLALMERV